MNTALPNTGNNEEPEERLNPIKKPIVEDSVAVVSAKQTPFPEVNWTQMNDVVVNYLFCLVKRDVLSSNNWSGVVDSFNAVSENDVKHVVQTVGSLFLKFESISLISHMNKYVLTGSLKVADVAPIRVIKQGIEALLDREHVDYFMREFGSRVGTDDEALVNLSSPSFSRYIPGMGELKQVCGNYIIAKADPFILLLMSDLADRKYLTLFFNEARNNGLFQSRQGDYRTNDINKVSLFEYCFSKEDFVKAIDNPQIIPFQEILRAGKLHDIEGLAGYCDRFEVLQKRLMNIVSSTY